MQIEGVVLRDVKYLLYMLSLYISQVRGPISPELIPVSVT